MGVRHGEPRIVPEGGEPLVGFDLTTHAGHFMGSGPQPPRPVHARRQGLRARRRHVGPDALAPRQGLREPGNDAQHAFWGGGEDPALSMLHQIAIALTGRVSDAVVIGAGPNGLAAAIRLAEAGRSGAHPRSRRRARRRRPHRGADAPGLPPRHVQLRLPGRRRLARVRADAAGRARAGVGAPGRRLRAPAARAARRSCSTATCSARPPASARRRRRRMGEVRQAVPGPLRRRARDDAVRLPAARRPDQAADRRRSVAPARLHAPAARARAVGLGQAPVRGPAARARGSTAPRCTATRRPTAPAPRSPRST